MIEFESRYVMQAYEELANYKVEKESDHPDISIIYFTSHALYYPDDDETVYNRIFVNDRYEFGRYRRQKLSGETTQEIFVRDVFKQWYICGINKDVNTVEKLAELLRILTEGTRVITVGSSAGGYAACLFGILLKADRIFTFSGQFDLRSQVNEGSPVLWEYRNNPDYNRYYNLREYVEKTDVPIFYFYPSGVKTDLYQHSVIQDCKSVHEFRIAGIEHGRTIYDQNLPYVFAMPKETLIQLSEKYRGQTVTPLRFSIENMTLPVNMKSAVYNIKKTAGHLVRKLVRR